MFTVSLLMWNPLNSSPAILRCPVMLVVGDQAPYEDAAVSLTCCFYLWLFLHLAALSVLLFVATRWSATAKWTQQRLHSWRYFFGFYPFFGPSLDVVFTRLSSLSSDGRCRWSTSADSGNVTFKQSNCQKIFSNFICQMKCKSGCLRHTY